MRVSYKSNYEVCLGFAELMNLPYVALLRRSHEGDGEGVGEDGGELSLTLADLINQPLLLK